MGNSRPLLSFFSSFLNSGPLVSEATTKKANNTFVRKFVAKNFQIRPIWSHCRNGKVVEQRAPKIIFTVCLKMRSAKPEMAKSRDRKEEMKTGDTTNRRCDIKTGKLDRRKGREIESER